MTDIFGSVKALAGALAVFATCFSLITAPDINLFYSNYFAGFATGIASFMWLDEEESQ